MDQGVERMMKERERAEMLFTKLCRHSVHSLN
jgi:hypothetical protein